MFNKITLGPITVYMYGLMIAIGFASALFLCNYRGKKRGLSEDTIFGIFLCALIGGMVGCRLLFYIVEIPSIMEDPSILWDFKNGYVVYGGIIGGIVTSYVYCRIKKENFISYFDLVMPAVPMAQGFGRIGCFLAGCCYGRETDSIFSVNVCPITPSSVNSFFYIIIIQILCISQVIHTFYLKPHIIKRRCFRYDGYMFYCIVYCVLYYGYILLC